MTRLFARLGAALLIALVAGVGLGLGLSATGLATGLRLPGLGRGTTAGSGAATPEEMQQAFVRVAERVRPAVVSIATSHFLRRQRPPGSDPFSGDPSFKDFYDR